LSTQAGWNQRDDDWRMAIEMTPGASFCATASDLLVGTCIGISYGELSWIAMMLVDSAFQRRGLGAALLLRAIEALPQNRPIGLDATAVGRLLYEQHGFDVTCSLTRWIAEQPPRSESIEPLPETTIESVTPFDLDDIAAADRDVFGANRRRVLEWAASVGPRCCAIARIDGVLAGYAFGRTGRVFTHVGTIAARSQPIAEALVHHVARTAAVPIGVDAFDALPQWTDWLKTHGFEPQRPLVRMVRKAPQERSSAGTQGRNGAAAEMRQYSIFGPEFA
jgi:ribosomal protein S18 acetylase RimI-like enzyme